ncbi:response regulator transcription factor [Acidicapsa ligni]|uniref:response regulator transcription factor n=1 Tax=Acidicapsa ligni TaxID=542300 RepID=UPI0021E0B10F|nr:response regulator [Acidicapsa ligni]
MIAIVDDDFRIRESLVNLLEAEEYAVKAYSSAEEFIADNERTVVDCLISDISMPGIGGLELLQRMRSEHPAIPVIMITARGRRFDEEPFIKAGAQAILHKPFDCAELLHAVTNALAARRRQ